MMLTPFQDNLFEMDAPEDLSPEVIDMVHQADAIGISTSGGKDSQAMMNYILRLRDRHDWQGECFALHADLGEIEWPGTRQHIDRQCQAAGIPLVVVRNPKGLIGMWRDRYETLLAQGNTKPFWSSSGQRYCTSDAKVAPSNKYLRRFKSPVCFVGIRAEESKERQKKPHYCVRPGITTKSLQYKGDPIARLQERHAIESFAAWPQVAAKARRGSICRFALTVNPLLDWSLNQVWRECGTSAEELNYRRNLFVLGQYEEAFSGFPAHWAYIAGSSRLSCSMCVLASLDDITIGAKLNQRTWRKLVNMEKVSGWTFKRDRSLASLEGAIAKFTDTDKVYAALAKLDLVTM